MKTYTFLISVVFSISITFGQKSIEKAHEYKQKGEYSNAIEEFKRVLRADLSSAEISKIYFSIGNCYNKIKDYDSAIKYYKKSIETAEANKLIYYQLAEVLLGKCLYEKALYAYLKLLDTKEIGDTDLDLDSDARRRITMIRDAISSTQKDIGKVSITGMDLFNSEYSEFGLYYNNRTIYFASMRLRGMISKKDVRTIQGLSKIYSSSLIQDKHKAESNQTTKHLPVYHLNNAWTTPTLLSSPFNSRRYNNSTITIDHTINTAYVTQCKGVDGDCKIFSVDFDEYFNGKNALPINISSDNYSVGHPTITSDGKTMFFVSDMPGGYGGTDIWISHKQIYDDNWSTPMNAGPIINTSKNEMFPYLYQDSILIFSSTGHLGYGGLDLFYSLFTGKKDFTEPVNFGIPINSGADDFSFIISQELRGGFFCSNRPGGIGNDDIYYYSGMPFRIVLRGLITDGKTTKPISGATVLYSSNSLVPDTIYSDINGTFKLFLQSGQKYTFDIFKDGYSNIRSFSTYGTDITSVLEEYYLNIVLFPSEIDVSIEGFVKESKTKKPFSDMKVIIVGDEGHYDQTETDTIGYYSFHDLKDETKYTLIMAKEGFWTQTKVLEIPKLSRSKVFSLATGYDFNFEAKEIDSEETTEIDLKGTIIYYEYDKADLLDTSKTELDKIIKLLRENPNLTVELSSHCDERGGHEYNDDLSQRRAQSVVNYLVNNNIPKNKLIAKGYGKRKLIVKNAQTEQEHQLNRRTGLRVLQIGEHDYNSIVESVVSTQTSKDRLVESKEIRITDDKEITKLKELAPKTTSESSEISSVIFKVQILTTRQIIDDYSYFRKAKQAIPGLRVTEEKCDDGWIRYYSGEFTDSNKAIELRDKLKKAGYEKCVVSIFIFRKLNDF